MRTHFGDYWPPDFGWTGNKDPLHNPGVLVPFTHSGVSFGSMNSYVVGLFTAFLDELVPHIRNGLHPGKCGCYNPHSVSEDGTRSFHTFGIAIDVNWDSNPMAAINPPDPGDIPHAFASRLAQKYGLEYGGDWQSPKDWMHFEVHLTPEDAATIHPTISEEIDVDENTLRAIIRDELNKGVTVNTMRAWDNNDADPKTRDPHNPETLFMGIPGYRTVTQRENEAKK